jgi:hypothetical protein
VDRHVREGANIAVVENKLDIDFARVEVKPHLFLELYHLYGVCVCVCMYECVYGFVSSPAKAL